MDITIKLEACLRFSPSDSKTGYIISSSYFNTTYLSISAGSLRIFISLRGNNLCLRERGVIRAGELGVILSGILGEIVTDSRGVMMAATHEVF